MTVYYRTQGFIFKKTDLREADRIFDIYTKDFGKLEVLGRSIRKIKSKLRAGTEVFYLSEIEFIQGKTYKTLTDASGRKKFKNIRMNLEKLETAFRISEILKNFLKFQEPDKKIWNLIITTFKKLDIIQNTKYPMFTHSKIQDTIYYYFLWNFLSLFGYEPELNRCVLCENLLQNFNDNKIYFSLKNGGIICQNCLKKTSISEKKYVKQINSETLKILKTLLRENLDILTKIKITHKEKRNLETLSENFLSLFSKI